MLELQAMPTVDALIIIHEVYNMPHPLSCWLQNIFLMQGYSGDEVLLVLHL